MAPDWPKDRWFQEGGVRRQSTGPSFLGLGNGWGKLVERMHRAKDQQARRRPGDCHRRVCWESSATERRFCIIQQAGCRLQAAGYRLQASHGGRAGLAAAGARNEMRVLCRAASQKLATQQGRASVPSPRSLTIAFSALLSGRMLQPSGNKPPSPCRGCVKYGKAVHVLCQNVCRGPSVLGPQLIDPSRH